MPIPSRKRLGRYEVHSRIGAGGMGEVYLEYIEGRVTSAKTDQRWINAKPISNFEGVESWRMTSASVRKKILNAVPPLGQQVNSDGPTAALFTKLTGGVTHDRLVKNWEGGGIMTTCNEFVGWFGRALGSKEYLGRFDIETYLAKIGKGHAWVPAASGAWPKYGDIFRPKSFHMGISLNFAGETWNTVESGQGGPKAKRDIIKRKQTTYDASKLQGWVDLELYFDSAAQVGPIPEWLVGWWKVSWRGQAYYYYFDRNRQVKWTQILPHSTSQFPLAASDTGNFAVEVPNAVTIRWGATGSVEKFSRVPVTNDEQMRGTWNSTEPLTAVKM